MLEPLESRRLLSDGIQAAPGPSLSGIAGQQFNAVVASYVVTDPSGEPGEKWAAHVFWGDGLEDRRLSPFAGPSDFEFIATHTYANPGDYTISVQIAVPGSHIPDNNTQMLTASIQPAPEPSPLFTAALASTTLLLQRKRRRQLPET